MKGKVISRCLIGAPVGLTISHIILLIISVCINNGTFSPVHPALTEQCGNELNAVLVQTICSILYGAAFAGASVVWEVERWSLFKQTAVHCAIITTATLPIAYLMHWMHHSIVGALLYLAVFFVIYVAVWLSQYLVMKRRIKALNAKVGSDEALH